MELKRIQEQLVEMQSRLATLRQDTELSKEETMEMEVLQVARSTLCAPCHSYYVDHGLTYFHDIFPK